MCRPGRVWRRGAGRRQGAARAAPCRSFAYGRTPGVGWSLPHHAATWLLGVNRYAHRAPGHGAELADGAHLLAGQPGLIRPPDIPYPAELLGYPDGARGDVDLPLEHAMPRAGRVGMMQVVPRLAERQHGQPRHVLRLVPGLELALTEGVADRVDRPGDVMQERDPDQAGPEERDHGALPRHRPQPADQGGEQQSCGNYRAEELVYGHDVAVGQPVRGELLVRGDVAVEQPAHVRPGHALG